MDTPTKEFAADSIGAKKIGVKFISGNNDVLQNSKESFARHINRIEKHRHLGQNFDQHNVNALNECIDLAQHYQVLSNALVEKAIKLNH